MVPTAIETEKRLTFPEFRFLEVDDPMATYELIDGVVYKRSSPNLPHQRVSLRLSHIFESYNDKKKAGKFFAAPTDVFLDKYNGVVPDLCFVSNERSFLLHNDEYVDGAPDLIVEILSPGTAKYDRGTKMKLYETFAVKEYWLIDPYLRTVEVFSMKNNAYFPQTFLDTEGQLTSSILRGFVLEISELFS